jgi:uncharacterized membrane protein affecting hemolysin expression
MAMQIDWVQVVQLSPFRSLQTKATLLVIAIVAGVLALSTVLNIQVSERALERDLRDNAMALARQFAAGIGSWEELNSRATLEVEIRQVMNSRSGIARVEVYAIVQGGPLSSSPAMMRSPRPAQALRSPRQPERIGRWRFFTGVREAASGTWQYLYIFMES